METKVCKQCKIEKPVSGFVREKSGKPAASCRVCRAKPYIRVNVKEVINIEGEVWLPVPEYEGYYEVSNFGRVKSSQRVTQNISKNRVVYSSILNQYVTDRGYHSITIATGIVKINKRVHRLVAMAFIPNPENKPFVNHIDSDTHNNHVSNLEWCTPKENTQHGIKHGNINSKYCSNKVGKFNMNGDLIEEYASISKAAKANKTHARYISECNKGEREHVLGFKWKVIEANHYSKTKSNDTKN